ncbi:MAG: glycerol-3-phosphate acyltransferase [SAR202 cluster bacterium]|nr:glycerol-3-phosphate acyltransferase [SAR202 cluster bacterium]
MIEIAVALVAAFFLGSAPTAYLVGRAASGVDIRRSGSGNPGALNAYRQLGKTAGVIVLLADSGKGAAAVYLGQRLDIPMSALAAVAAVAALGHNFSPFLKFRGGKGGAVVLGISAIMLLGITAVTVAFGAVLYGVTRHAVWAMTGTFLLLNALTIATLQPVGQISLCLALSALVAGTHLWRQYPQVSVAMRERAWRRFMTIE